MHLASFLSPPSSRDVSSTRDVARDREIYERRDQSNDKLIALLERNYEQEMKEKDGLQMEASHQRMSRNASESCSGEQNVSGITPYYMGGMNLQYANSRRIHQTVNAFSAPSSVNNLDARDEHRSLHRHEPRATTRRPTTIRPSSQMIGGQAGRRGSWFQSDNFHTGRNAPSGRTTLAYWDGQREGRSVGNAMTPL